ncbi:MAG: flagellar basal body P-ring protein FlgI [Proteobacteria bacterium]|nr:flagellar basal body P-ring protein FlgI [Pseudomonadota bacterium]MBU1716472.1 flagellar basal body P-ring protein FlgI [Pseudomonadota bacterium]
MPLRDKALFLCFLVMFLLTPGLAQAVRLKDIASVKGVRTNQLVGYGLVVGLNGTGDGSQASFTSQGLVNMLENMGIHVNRDGVKVKNVAGVMITAKMPAFIKPGQMIDVVLSSMGDCTSLQGGTLVAVPLKGLDGKVYAMAQGPVSIGGFEDTGLAVGAGQKRHATVARIPNGATVEKSVPISFLGKEKLTLSLDVADFTTTFRMVNAIDNVLGGPYATALDGATVDVKVPEKYHSNEVAFLAMLENLQIIPDGPARVVLDERTGTVVMGENVRISKLALSHGNLSLQVKGLAGGLVPIEEGGVSLGEIVRALNSIGVAPRDLIAIFQSIKASGSLQAELEII